MTEISYASQLVFTTFRDLRQTSVSRDNALLGIRPTNNNSYHLVFVLRPFGSTPLSMKTALLIITPFIFWLCGSFAKALPVKNEFRKTISAAQLACPALDCPQSTLDLWLADATSYCNANVNTNLKPLTKCWDSNIMAYWNKRVGL